MSAIPFRTESRVVNHPALSASAGFRPFMATEAPLADLLRLFGVAVDPSAVEGVDVPLRRVRTGAALFHEGARAEAIHVVRSGTFKCLKTLEDGYEQVLAFAGVGDVLGFDALASGHLAVGAMALEDSTVFVLPLRDFDAWRHDSPPLDHALQFALSRQLARAGETAEMMAAVAAEVRLARFLVWLSARMAERGQSPRRLRLRMSRRDIASFLGVAHETVSRSFGALADAGILSVDNREVEIVDAQRLHACSRSTRGFAAEMRHPSIPSSTAPRLASVHVHALA